MEIKEALNVLKLTEPFTQDDLRKAFRREMSANHPDNFSTESDEIQKHQIEIAQMLNEAREILTNHLRSNPYSWSYNESSELSNAKSHYCNLINNYKTNGRRYVFLKNDSSIYGVDFLVFTFNVKISLSNSKQDVEKCYSEFLSQLRSLYLKTLEEYRYSYCISVGFDELKYNFNFECTADEFAKSLEDYREKYYKYIKQHNINAIDTLTDEFKGYAGYDALKDIIDSLKRVAIDKLGISLNSTSFILNELRASINNVFHTYFDNVKKYDELVSKYDRLGIIDDSIDNRLQDLKAHITDFDEFSKMYKQLLIEISKKVVSADLNKTYQDLLQKYTAELSGLNFCDNVDRINLLSSLLERINTILSKILEFENSGIDPDGLRKITFKDTEADLKIIEDYENQVGEYSSSTENLIRILSGTGSNKGYAEPFQNPNTGSPQFK